MKKQCNLLLLLLLIPLSSFSTATDYTFVKQKNIQKAYFVNPDAGLTIDNSYGTILVSTWDEDKIEFNIQIKVSGDKENWVNQRIDDITVDINALKGWVSAKTIIENSNTKNNGKNNSFEINYSVKIPKNGSVKLLNKYGNISTSDLFGSTDITCKYGKITLGKLYNSRNAIQMEYCSASSIAYMKYGNVLSRYSGLTIDEVDKLDLVSDYTDVVIANSGDVKIISKYGAIKLATVNSLDATGNYLSIKIGTVMNQLKLVTRYSDVAIGAIQSRANDVTIVSGYSGLNIGFQSNYAFDFDVSVRYADFKYDSDLEISSKAETNNSKKYNGFYKKKGVNKMTIVSDYGNVVLRKN
ncbi:hypothetical protein [Flavobacterium restrictum]|uniref:Adhesin domain-containing protein n=1 Tax=Flavobacterium restrictum TaxID=2594428 RepID=A0A553E746_9FLAO|nr:hypothetical protein [Flavobacterium restrictum]TRX40839.1 hypothetical protein FNW21_05935 [Flavobacterium restrictum]